MNTSPTESDAKRLERLEKLDRVATWSDSAITVPGTSWKIGWDFLIGLIPGVGDVAGLGLSAYVIEQGRHLGVRRSTLARMSFNALLDALLGSLPLVGDLFDASFKANRRNVELIRRDVENSSAKNSRAK